MDDHLMKHPYSKFKNILSKRITEESKKVIPNIDSPI